MKKLLVICGPTAVGKTKLALRLTKVFDGEIISADSRQVYRGMDIGTGKGLPQGFKYQVSSVKDQERKMGFYANGKTRIWGLDLVEPHEEFSVAQYERIVRKIINLVSRRNKLPILVGGTGLYIKAVVDGIPTMNVPKNKELREKLEEKSTPELFEILAQLSSAKAAQMNTSDRGNRRRLIRAIEVAQWNGKKGNNISRKKGPRFDTLFVGLFASPEALGIKIDKRVKARVAQGVENEIIELLKKGVDWDTQSMSALGNKLWKPYFLGRAKKSEVIDKWIRKEKDYARRQMTWFKADKRIHWFNIAHKDWEKEVENMVKKWYSFK